MTIEHDVSAANQTLDWAHELGLDWTDVVGADPRTIHRWQRGRSAPRSEHRKRIQPSRAAAHARRGASARERTPGMAAHPGTAPPWSLADFFDPRWPTR